MKRKERLRNRGYLSRCIALLLSFAMVVTGINLPEYSTPAKAADGPSGYTSNDYMAYQVKSNGTTVDIMGMYKNEWIKTTYSNGGYQIATQNLDNGTVTVTPSFSKNGRYIMLSYKVSAVGGNIADGKLAIGADVQIGSNDRAEIKMIREKDNVVAFQMKDDDSSNSSYEGCFRLYFAGDMLGKKAACSTYWIGAYGGYMSHCYEQCTIDTFSGTDSALCLSWQDINLSQGQSAEYNIMLGVGTEKELDEAAKVDPATDYFNETIGNLEQGSYTVKCNGNSYRFNIESDDQEIPLQGMDVNGKSYDFIGKNLTIQKDATSTTQASEEVSLNIKARPTTPEQVDASSITPNSERRTVTISPATSGQEYIMVPEGQELTDELWENAVKTKNGQAVFDQKDSCGNDWDNSKKYVIYSRVSATEDSLRSEISSASLEVSFHVPDWVFTVDEDAPDKVTAKCLVEGCQFTETGISMSLSAGGSYNGRPMKVDVINKDDFIFVTETELGEISYYQVKDGEEIKLNSAPVDAGDYLVKVPVLKDGETKAEMSLPFRIDKSDVYVSVYGNTNLTYNEEPQSLLEYVYTEGGTLYYRVGEDGEWSTDRPTAEEVGDYKIYYYVKGDKNHYDRGSESEPAGCVPAMIAPATLPEEDVTAASYEGVYDKQPHTIGDVELTGKAEGAAVTYATEADGIYTEEKPTFTDVADSGSYTVYYKVSKEGFTSIIKSATVTIIPKPVSIKWDSDDLIYNGKAQAPKAEAEGVLEGDSCEVIVSGSGVNATQGEETYTAHITGLSNKNYTLAEDAVINGEYRIAPKPVTLSWENLQVTYNGRMQTPSAVADNLEGEDSCQVSVAVYNTDTVGITPANAKDAGLYTAVAVSMDNPNYTIPEDNTVAFMILPKRLNSEDVTYVLSGDGISYNEENGTYSYAWDGGYKAPDITVKDSQTGEDVTLQRNVDYTVSGEQSSDTLGSHIFYLTGKGNYGTKVRLDRIRVTWNIEKSVISPKITVADWIYGQLANEPEVSDAQVEGDVTYTYYTDEEYTKPTTQDDGAATEGGVPKNAGTYYVKAVFAETSYYKEATAQTSFRIHRKAVRVVPKEGQKKTYGEMDPEFTYDAELVGHDTLEGSLSREEGEDVGTYRITAGNLHNNNYEITVEDGVKFTVGAKKLTADMVTVSPLNYPYDGEEHTPSLSYYDESLETENTELTENDVVVKGDTSASDYGVYTLLISGRGNYTGTVNKKWSVSNVKDTVVTYDGTAHGVEVLENNDGVKVLFKDENGEYTLETPPTEVHPGSYHFDYQMSIYEGDELEPTVACGSATLVIKKIVLRPQIELEEAIGYGEDIIPSLSGNDGDGNVKYYYKEKSDPEDSFSENVPEDAGEYTVKAVVAETEFYTGAEVTKNFVIAKKELATIDPQEVYYAKADVGEKTANTDEMYKTLKGVHYQVDQIEDANGILKRASVSEEGVISYELSGQQEQDGTAKILVRISSTNYQDVVVTLTVHVDATAPTGTITIAGNTWRNWMHTISFGLFFKESKEVTIAAQDDGIGVESIKYYVAPAQLADDAVENLEESAWTDYEPFRIEPNSSNVIYAKLTDKAGNMSIISSDGVVIYTDSAPATEQISYTRMSHEDVEAFVALNGNTIKSIQNEDNVLSVENDYTIDGERILLKSSYLDTLKAGTYTLKLSYNPLGKEYVETKNEDGEDQNEKPQTTAITLIVKKVKGSVADIEDLTKEYDKTPVKIPEFKTTNQFEPEDVRIEYKKTDEEDSTYTETAPVDAGDYTVRITVPSDENYLEASGKAEFTIEPKVIRANVTAENKIYDGTTDADVAASVETGIEGEELRIIHVAGSFQNKNAGTKKTVRIDSSETIAEAVNAETKVENYDIYYPSTIKANISAKTINVSWGDNELVYNGSSQAPQAEAVGLIAGDECKVVVEGMQTDTNRKSRKDTYTAEAAGVDNSNYVLSEENRTKDYTIIPSEIDVTWSNTEFTYDGEEHKPTAAIDGVFEGTDCEAVVSPAQTDANTEDVPEYQAELSLRGNDAENYTIKNGDESVSFTIKNADQDAPELEVQNETISEKADGRILGLTTAMEYRLADAAEDSYEKAESADMTFAAGTYQVRYAAKKNYNASAETTVVIGAGRMLMVSVPEDQTGYTLTCDPFEVSWKGNTSLKLTLADGYSRTEAFAVKAADRDGENEQILTTDEDGKYVLSDITADTVITVEGVADVTAPEGEIAVDNNKWSSFLESITFGTFFKERKDVTITASDAGSGVDEILYMTSDKVLTEDEVKAITDWTTYSDTLHFDGDQTVIVYAKLTDHAGNVRYLSSDGMVFDETMPVISGVREGQELYVEKDYELHVIDENLDKVYVTDGTDTFTDEDVVDVKDGAFNLRCDSEKTQKITVIDKAGNRASVQVVFVSLKKLKDAAKDAVQKEAEKLKKQINALPDLTPEQKQKVLDEIEDQQKKANEAIDSAENRDGVSDQQKEALDELSKELEQAKDTDLSNAKDTASKAIDKKAEEAKKEIENLSDLTEEEKTAAKAEVDKKAEAAKDAIAKITDPSDKADVSVNKDKAEAAMDKDVSDAKNADLSNAKDTASKAIDKKAEEAKKEIDALTDLTEEEKTAAKAEVDKKAEAAKDVINKITDPSDKADVSVNKDKADQAMDKDVSDAKNADLSNAKDTATKDIDKKAEEAKKEIDALTDLTEEEKEAAKAEVDKKAETAKSEIAKVADPASKSAVSKNKDSANTAMDKDVSNAKDADLSNAKDTATKDIDKKAEEAKKTIDSLSDLTEEEKEAAKAEVDKKAEAAKDAINKITDPSDKADVSENKDKADKEIEKEQFLAGNKDLGNAKDSAIKEIDKRAEEAKQTIDGLSDLTEQEKENAKKEIEEKAETAKEAISQITDFKDKGDVFEHKYGADTAMDKDVSDAKNTDLSNAKDTASKAIDKKAEEAKKEIDALTDLTEEEKEAAKAEVDKKAEAAKDAINKITDPSDKADVSANKDKADAAMDKDVSDAKNADLSNAKDTASKAIDKKAEEAKKEIDALTDLTDEEKEAAKAEVDKKAEAAKSEIAKVTDPSDKADVSVDKDSADQAMDKKVSDAKNADLSNAKDTASKAIDKKAEEAKKAIDGLTDLTDEEKEVAKAEVDKKAEAAKSEIAKVTDPANKADVSINKDSADAAMDKDVSDAKDADLSNAKDTASKDIDKKAEEAKKTIDDLSDLTEEEKEAAKAEIDKKAEAAKSEIDKITDPANKEDVSNNKDSADKEIEKEQFLAGNKDLGNAKDTAIKEIDKRAEEAKQTIDGLSDLTEQEKEEAKKEIDKKAETAKEAISQITDSKEKGDVFDYKYGADTAMDKDVSDAKGTDLSNAKDTAAKEIDKKAEEAKKAIDALTDLTDDEKEAAKAEVDKKAEVAKSEIAKVTDPASKSAVSANKDSADQAMDKDVSDAKDTDLSNAKNTAVKEIDKKAEEAKKAIDALDDLTEKEKEAAKAEVDKKAEAAKSEIAKITDPANKADVSTNKDSADTAMDKDVSDAKDTDLSNAKDTATKDIDKKAEEAKKEIENLSDLTEEEKTAAKAEVDKKAEAAKSEIAKVADPASKSAVSANKDNADAAIKNEQTVAENKDLDNAKDSAKAAIDKQTEESIADIDALDNLTKEEKEAAKEEIRKQAEAAKSDIDAADKKTEVKKTKSDADKNMTEKLDDTKISDYNKTKDDNAVGKADVVVNGTAQDPETRYTISLRVGSTEVEKITDVKAGENVSFDKLPDGVYNLVVSDGNNRTTTLVTVIGGKASDIGTVTVGNKNTSVDVKINAPKVAVGGLETIFDTKVYTDNKNAVDAIEQGDGRVDMRLISENALADADIEQEVSANKTIYRYMNFMVDMIVTDAEGKSEVYKVADTEKKILLAIPFKEEEKNRTGYELLRKHNDGEKETVEKLPELIGDERINPSQEGFYIENNTLYVWAQKFSVYALAYDEGSVAPTPVPTTEPTEVPSQTPSTEPTAVPSQLPAEPTIVPTQIPTMTPTNSPKPGNVSTGSSVTTVSKTELEKNALTLNAKLKVSQTGSKINISWGKVTGASGYDVYVQYCGQKFTVKSLTQIESGKTTSIVIKKVNGKKLNLKKNYKIYVVAYKMNGSRKVILGKTITAHIVGRQNYKNTNAKGIKLKKNAVTLSVGEKTTIKGKTILVDPKKKPLSNAHAKELRFASTDKKVAVVSSKGEIKAVAKGSCTVYVYARNGYAKKVKVTVK